MQPSQNVWPHLVRTGALSESQQIGQRSSRSVAVAEVLVMCRSMWEDEVRELLGGDCGRSWLGWRMGNGPK